MYNTGRLLTLTEVLKIIGWDNTADRSAMNRYTTIDEVRTLLGAVGDGRNIKYPEESVPLFRALATAHKTSEVSPKNAVPFLRRKKAEGTAIDAEFYDEDRDIAEESDTPPNAGIALVPLTAQVERIGITFADTIIQRIQESGVLPERAPVEDRVIGREEAAHLLCVKPGAVGRHVRAIGKDRWSRNMVLEKIAQLRAAAERKPNKG